MLRSSKLVLNACRKKGKRNEIPCIQGAFSEINDVIKNAEINEIKTCITTAHDSDQGWFGDFLEHLTLSPVEWVQIYFALRDFEELGLKME